MFSHIVCTTTDSIIGINNQLPWDTVPEDLKFFKEKTLNNIVVMGRNNFESLNNNPLPYRVNIVVSKTLEEVDDKPYIVFKTLEEALEYAEDLADLLEKEVFIIGGSEIYQQTYDMVDKIYLNTISSKELVLKDIYTSKDRNTLTYYISKFRLKRDFDITYSQEIPTSNSNVKLLSYVLDRIK